MDVGKEQERAYNNTLGLLSAQRVTLGCYQRCCLMSEEGKSQLLWN